MNNNGDTPQLASQFARSLERCRAKSAWQERSLPAESETDYKTSPEMVAFKYWLNWRAETQNKNLQKIKTVFGSPIERILFSGILCVATHWVDGIVYEYPDGSVATDGDTSTNVLYIAPQCQVGNYTVDFLLKWKRVVLHSSRQFIGGQVREITQAQTRIVEVVVECDGHDFHERTAEQARRDRERDRNIQDNYKILRFTGSEIWQDPVGCASQIRDAITSSRSVPRITPQ